jgi:hypothetical protein
MWTTAPSDTINTIPAADKSHPFWPSSLHDGKDSRTPRIDDAILSQADYGQRWRRTTKATVPSTCAAILPQLVVRPCAFDDSGAESGSLDDELPVWNQLCNHVSTVDTVAVALPFFSTRPPALSSVLYNLDQPKLCGRGEPNSIRSTCRRRTESRIHMLRSLAVGRRPAARAT